MNNNTKNSEIIYQELINNVREVLFVISTDWQKVYFVSPSYEYVWGRTCESLLQNPLSWLESLHTEDKCKVIQYIEEKVGGDLNEIIFPDYRVIQPCGTTKWISARCFPIRDKKGKIYRIAGIATDITCYKKAEEEKTKLIQSLHNALDEIKNLRGVLPLCSFCKKIRNSKGEWEDVDTYIYKNSEADISHTVCPVCMKRHYQEYLDKEK